MTMITSDSISLKKEQQSSFDKAVKRLRKRVKDGEICVQDGIPHNRGVVRLSRIPHGFYEDEIRQYFSQFGVVTRVRLARSRKTGNSKGFAFVEFKFPDVAKVVAETMNNYLMFDKILKVQYIPPEEQNFNYFIGVSKHKVPKEKNRKAAISLYNRKLTEEEKKQFYSRVSENLKRQLNKIEKLGIHYDFKPVQTFNMKNEKAVLTLDESDEEISFKIPSNMKVIKKKSTPAVVSEKRSSPNAVSASKNAMLKTSKGERNSKKSNSHSPPLTVMSAIKPLKMTKTNHLCKSESSKMSVLERSVLRDAKKQGGLKAMNKVKMSDKKKMKATVQMHSKTKSLMSKWQIKEKV